MRARYCDLGPVGKGSVHAEAWTCSTTVPIALKKDTALGLQTQ
jgi:hypothetical protein